MIVVDTNVVASLLLATTHTGQAEDALRRDPEWAAPLLWRSELRNVLASLVRAQRLSLPAAIAMAEVAESLLRGKEYSVPSDEVLDAARASGCTAYDCEFVVLARSAGCPLVTLDRAVIRAFPDVALALNEFIS